MTKGGTGIIFDTNAKEAFEYFINNSTFEYLSKGANGITVIATLKPGFVTKYKNLDSEIFNQPVTKIIIKLLLINPIDKKLDLTLISLNTCKSEDVIKEVNIQTEIVFNTFKYLDPLCPVVLYSSNDYGSEIIDIMISNSNERTNELFSLIKQNFVAESFEKIGIIAMEFADGYTTLFKLLKLNTINDDIKKNYITMSAYLVIQLALQTGYTQADFHTGNIMINIFDNVYFANNIQGKPLIIDFGYANKISSAKISEIKNLFNSTDQFKYTKILLIICSVNRSDNLDVRKFKEYYGYLCGRFDALRNIKVSNINDLFNDVFNNEIDNLFKSREIAINNQIEFFNSEHIKNPEIYPLLPLSNNVKNKMFNGIINTTLQLVLPNLNFTNQSFVNENKFKILIDWIYDICKVLNLPLSSKFKLFINTCYNIVYLMNNINNIKRLKFQLIGLIGLWFAENKQDIYKFTTYNNEEKLIRFIVNISSGQYNKEEIQSNILKYSPLFENVYFQPFYNYLSITCQEIIINVSTKWLVNILIDPETYISPKVAADKLNLKCKSDNNEYNALSTRTHASDVGYEEMSSELPFYSETGGKKLKTKKLKTKKLKLRNYKSRNKRK
jgi:hypothetical protein